MLYVICYTLYAKGQPIPHYDREPVGRMVLRSGFIRQQSTDI
jgi:hypothetical protein